MRTLIMSGLLVWQITSGFLWAQGGFSSASVSRTRSHGLLEPQQVILEEFMNYHTHAIPLPGRGQMLAMELKADRLGRIGYEGKYEEWIFQLGLSTQPVEMAVQRPPVHISLVVDGSGSMNGDRKMEKVKNALGTFLEQLRPDDQVSLVRFSSVATLEYQGYAYGPGLQSHLQQIYPGGGTNLQAGLLLGLEQLEKLDHRQYRKEVERRLILLTDGLANEGIVDLTEIMASAERFLETGIQISTIGVGGDVNFDLLAELSRQSGGQHHFIGSAEEDIVKVFQEEAESLLAPLLKDVYLTIDLPEELDLIRFYGYQPKIRGNQIIVKLPPLNRGLTQVLIFHASLPVGNDFIPVVAQLEGRQVENGLNRTWRSRFYAPDQGIDPYGWSDDDLRKNFCISHMAHTLREMALSCQPADCSAAGSLADGCINYVQETYPDLNDPDIRRILDMLKQQRHFMSMLE